MEATATTTSKRLRPRTFQACTRCRAGKIRCDGRTPTCTPCGDRGHDCVYPDTRRMRGPGKSSKARFEALEERLAAMESTLRQPDAGLTRTSPGRVPQPNRSTAPPPAASGGFASLHRISNRFARWQQEACTEPLKRQVLSPLTAEISELWLVEECLEDCYAELPFFRMPWSLDQLKRPDAVTLADAGWQGFLNATIANGLLFKTHTRSFHEVSPYSWAFFRNAYAVLPELIIHGDGPAAAQAVMAMAIFMRQSGDTRTTSRLLSTAIRICQSAPYLAAEEEDFSRLFWATFILDVETSLSTGLPPIYPESATLGAPNAPSVSSPHDVIFTLRVSLSQIQHKLITRLLANSQSDLYLLTSELETWRLGIPPHIRPDLHQPALPTTPGSNPLITLHLSYFSTLCTLSCAIVQHLASLSQPSVVHESAARSSAHAIISLCISIPRNTPFTHLYTILHHPLFACIVLLAIICKEPNHPDASSDISSLSQFAKHLSKLIAEGGCDLHKLRDGISRFEQVARDAVETARSLTGGTNLPVGNNNSTAPLPASEHRWKAIAALLTCEASHRASIHHLAQRFLGNIRLNHGDGRENAVEKKFAEILGLSEWAPDNNRGYGAFVPECLMPATYGFMFGNG